MSPISDNTRLIIWLITGVAGILVVLLTIYLERNIRHLFRKYISKNKGGPPPPQRSSGVWVVYILLIILSVTGTAVASSAPALSVNSSGNLNSSVSISGNANGPIIQGNGITVIINPAESSPSKTTITPSVLSTSAPSETLTNTPVPSLTETPFSTQTPLPSPTPDPKEFTGFDKNCIDQNYWGVSVFKGETPPNTYKQNSKNCYDLSLKGVNSQDQGLRFNISPLRSPFFGIYTSLPSYTNTDIHFKFNIDTFTTDINSPNAADGILIFGISDSRDWNFKSGNYLFYSIRYAYHSSDIHLEVGPSKIYPSFQWGIFTPKVSSDDILFSIRGVDLYIYVNGQTIDYYPRSLSQLNGREVFWIGYQLPVGKSNLRASLTDFSIVEK